MSISNPNCDGDEFPKKTCNNNSEVRRLPINRDSVVIVCYNHYLREIKSRKEWNNENPTNKCAIPEWEDLEVYQID